MQKSDILLPTYTGKKHLDVVRSVSVDVHYKEQIAHQNGTYEEPSTMLCLVTKHGART